MIPQKLTLHNFMSYQKPEPLDFNTFNIACLAGENGVGKSSLLEAISWVLWGKSRAGSDDDLINLRADEMWVELNFQAQGNNYKVLRKRSRKKRGHSELYLYSFNKKTSGFYSISEDKISDTQEKIGKLLKTPYRIFVNSAYLRQGKADEFTTKTAAERKEILAEILDLKLYDELSGTAREKAKIAKTETESLKIQIQDLKEQISEKPQAKNDFLKLKKQIATLKEKTKKAESIVQKLQSKIVKKQILDQENQTLSENLTDIIREGKELKIEALENLAEIKDTNQTLKQENKILTDFKKLQDLQKAEEQFAKKQIQVLELVKDEAALKADKNKIEVQISKISKISKCPTCLRKMSKNEADKIISNLKKELKDSVLNKLTKLNQKIKKIGYDKTKHQRIKEGIEELKISELEKNKLDRQKAVLKEKLKAKEKLAKQIQIKKKEYLEKSSRLKKVEKEIKVFIPFEEKLETEKADLENLQNQTAELREKIGVLRQKLTQIAESENRLTEKSKLAKKAEKETDIFLELADIFSKKGIQARILETAIPEIENQANIILDELTQSTMQIALVTQKKKKTSEDLIETLDIQIKDQLGARKYEMFSGGEAFRINFALRIALSRFLAQRAGAKLQFLAIDEGFGTQDEIGRRQLVEAINNISKDFEKILVITHIQELKDSFETRIDVTKDEKGSKIKIVY